MSSYLGETNIDECADNPCLNGKCLDGVAKYTCECDAGFEGINCDIEIDECVRHSPCVNGNCIGEYHVIFVEILIHIHIVITSLYYCHLHIPSYFYDVK